MPPPRVPCPAQSDAPWGRGLGEGARGLGGGWGWDTERSVTQGAPNYARVFLEEAGAWLSPGLGPLAPPPPQEGIPVGGPPTPQPQSRPLPSSGQRPAFSLSWLPYVQAVAPGRQGVGEGIMRGICGLQGAPWAGRQGACFAPKGPGWKQRGRTPVSLCRRMGGVSLGPRVAPPAGRLSWNRGGLRIPHCCL